MDFPTASSPISPVNLPKPYDISVAVHQALKLDLNTPPPTVRVVETTNIVPKKEVDLYECVSTGDIEELIPNVIDNSDFIDDVWDSVTLPEEIVDTDAWGTENTSANMDELERFCRYIDGDTETEEELENSFNSPEKKKRDSRNKHSNGMPAAAVGGSALQYLQVELVNSELWEEFNHIGTEMVITKNGRRMFPSLNLQVYGLNPDAVYSIYLDIMPADDRRYKFMQTDWVPIGRIDKKFNFREYMHPDSPNSGQYWMEKPILFKFLKLTNNKTTVHKDQIILNSMQKYQPTLRIKYHSQMGSGPETRSFPFPESSFIAVTAYQNNKITQLKIDNNPYARAFRDSTTGGDSNSSSADREQRRSNKRQSRSASTTPSPPFRNRTVKSHIVKSEGSATSVESGFESGSSCSEIINPRIHLMPGTYVPPLLSHSEAIYSGCQYACWGDENTLYNSNLIYPPPMLDPSASFSEPYLQQSSQVLVEAQIPSISPIKPLRHDIYQPPPIAPPSVVNFHDGGYEDDVFT